MYVRSMAHILQISSLNFTKSLEGSAHFYIFQIKNISSIIISFEFKTAQNSSLGISLHELIEIL